MNSLYTQGVRQTTSIQADLERMRSGEFTASLQGMLSLFPHEYSSHENVLVEQGNYLHH